MSDDIDIAAEREQLARDIAIRNHLTRRAAPLPLCAECEEVRVYVASNGCQWKYCADCAHELLGVQAS